MRTTSKLDRIISYVGLAAVLAGLLTNPGHLLGFAFALSCMVLALILPSVMAYSAALAGYIALSWIIKGSQRLYEFCCRGNISAGLATIIASFAAGLIWACL